MKSIIVAIHMLLIAGMYWIWRDFPRDQAWPEGVRYFLDGMAVLGVGAAIALLFRKSTGWIPFLFYMVMTLRLAAILLYMGKYGWSQRLGSSFDLAGLVLLLVFPFLLAFVPRRVPERPDSL